MPSVPTTGDAGILILDTRRTAARSNLEVPALPHREPGAIPWQGRVGARQAGQRRTPDGGPSKDETLTGDLVTLLYMVNRRRRRNTTLVSAAEGLGRTLGQLANRLDKLHKQRDAITARIEQLAHTGSEMFARLKRGAEADVAVVRRTVKRGRKAGFKMSAVARRKMSIAAKKRHATRRAALARK